MNSHRIKCGSGNHARRLRAAIEGLERRTLLSVGTLTAATHDFGGPAGPDAADRSRNVVYVADQGAQKILAVSTATGTTVGIAPIAANAGGVAVSIDDTKLYVSEPGAFQIEVFSLPNLTLLRTLHVGVAVNQVVAGANNRIIGSTGNRDIFDDTTGALLFTINGGGLLHTNPTGTILYSRVLGLSGNDGSLNSWDVGGIGAPVGLPNVPGPVGANSKDFAVDNVLGKAFYMDGGVYGITVVLTGNGNSTTWKFVNGVYGSAVAELPGGPYVYGMSYEDIEQFSQGGVVQATYTLPHGENDASLVITPNGNLMYTYGSGIGIVGLSTLNVTETPTLAFSAEPVSGTAGKPLATPVTVNVQNLNGTLDTSDQTSVNLTLASGPGALNGTLNVAVINGVATFSNVVLSAAGTYTFRATDGSYGSATSSSITIAAPHLAFVQQPSGGSLGAAIAPAVTVEILDASNQVMSTDTSMVTLSLASGAGGLGGMVAVAAKNGLATFSNLVLTAAGSHTLQASDGSDTPVTSNGFVTAVPHLAFVQQPTANTVGSIISPAVTVDILDSNNQLVATDNSTVTLSLLSGPGVLGGTISVAAQNGVATFSNLLINSAGAHTLLAADGSFSSASSASFTTSVAVASAPHLAFIQQPIGGTAGAAISPAVTVEILDMSGKLISTDNSTVTLALASGPGTLGGTLSVAAQNGIATFANIVPAAAGSHVLRATDGTDTSANSTSFTTAAPIAYTDHLAFVQQPAAVVAGAAISPAITVEVLDQNNALVTAGSASVTLSVGSGPSTSLSGTLSGSLTVATVNGIATFSGVYLDTAGIYTLAATGGNDAPAASSAFAVSPAAPSALVFVQQPLSTAVGQAINPAVTVEVLDSYSNIVTGYASDIGLSIGSGPAGATLQGGGLIAAQNGVATFAGLAIDQAGSYTLSATSVTLPAVASTAFAVSASSVGTSPTSPLVATIVGSTLPQSVVAGASIKAKVNVAISDSQGAFGGGVTVRLYADTNSTLSDSKTLVTSVAKGRFALKAAQSKSLTCKIKSLPAALTDGTYYLFAEITDTSGRSSVTALPQTVLVAAPFIQPTVGPISVAVGKTGTMVVTVTNTGNETARGIDLTLSVSKDGATPLAGIVLGNVKSGTQLKPQQTKTFKLKFKITGGIAAGSYFPYVSVLLNGVSTTAVGATAFTVA